MYSPCMVLGRIPAKIQTIRYQKSNILRRQEFHSVGPTQIQANKIHLVPNLSKCKDYSPWCRARTDSGPVSNNWLSKKEHTMQPEIVLLCSVGPTL